MSLWSRSVRMSRLLGGNRFLRGRNLASLLRGLRMRLLGRLNMALLGRRHNSRLRLLRVRRRRRGIVSREVEVALGESHGLESQGLVSTSIDFEAGLDELSKAGDEDGALFESGIGDVVEGVDECFVLSRPLGALLRTEGSSAGLKDVVVVLVDAIPTEANDVQKSLVLNRVTAGDERAVARLGPAADVVDIGLALGSVGHKLGINARRGAAVAWREAIRDVGKDVRKGTG